jgi:hypothetical protein
VLQGFQQLDGLDHTGIEAGPEGAAAVFLFAVAGDGDEAGRGGGRVAPERGGDAVAVHAGEAQVAENEVGAEVLRGLEGGRSGVGQGCLGKRCRAARGRRRGGRRETTV